MDDGYIIKFKRPENDFYEYKHKLGGYTKKYWKKEVNLGVFYHLPLNSLSQAIRALFLSTKSLIR